jgi:hypothetical protein
MDDLVDEDRGLREHFATFGPEALRELEGVLDWPQTHRDEILRQMVARPDLAELAQLIALADIYEVVRLRLLRAIRDLGVGRRETLSEVPDLDGSNPRLAGKAGIPVRVCPKFLAWEAGLVAVRPEWVTDERHHALPIRRMGASIDAVSIPPDGLPGLAPRP